MTAVQKITAILELTPDSTEEDAKNTYDAWALTYEEVCWQYVSGGGGGGALPIMD